jgi:hypothetical protein
MLMVMSQVERCAVQRILQRYSKSFLMLAFACSQNVFERINGKRVRSGEPEYLQLHVPRSVTADPIGNIISNHRQCNQV